ncbi:MAG: ABC transporter ATP-binding protein [Halioglobus sp.]|nr:ABC transporter ATP-binding protein [Halioglobus sp.]
MIEAQSLTRYYGSTPAVLDVSFQIGDNEIVGLLGHNGAGKTTVMRMLSGHLEPERGRVLLDGLDIAPQPRRLQRQLGYLPEHLPVYPDMLVVDYLEYAATLRGIAAKQRMHSVREVLAATDLTHRALDRISALSRGMRQRVGVAQAILDRPRLLILDEPTNGLDPSQTDHMRELLRRLARRATVILSTHILQEVDAVCDRVLVLRNGRLAVDERLENLDRSRSLLLRTDNRATALPAALAALKPLVSVQQGEPTPGCWEFRLQLGDTAMPDDAASEVARCVISSGAQLYSLASAGRDLGSLFREANSDGD